MKLTALIIPFFSIGILSTPLKSFAHPHSWIELKTEIDGTETEIIGFKMQWTFDAMTSAYMLDGYDLSPKHKAQSFQDIADSVINNMYAEHYFTYFYDGEKPVRYKTAINAKLTQTKAKATLSFYLPLSIPQPAHGQQLRLLIFEPSYYVDMSWQNKSEVSLSPLLATSCTFQLIEPTPTTEQINYAMSLPADTDPDTALGQLFTQTVSLDCKK
jgi:tRNA threonylcarbamoyladenosine biosynthesis protein TsaE